MSDLIGADGQLMCRFDDHGTPVWYPTLAGVYKKPETTLCELSLQYGSDKCGNGYTAYYYREWVDIRMDVRAVLEIGVSSGASLKMWANFFPNARVVGIDNGLHETKPAELETDRIKIVRGDQTNEADMARAVELCGGPIDIVVDDGSHLQHDQQWSMWYLFPHLRAGGWYVVEDLSPESWGMAIESDLSRRVFEHYITTGEYKSNYLSVEQNAELANQIAFAHFHFGNYEDTKRPYEDISPKTWSGGILCLFRKR